MHIFMPAYKQSLGLRRLHLPPNRIRIISLSLFHFIIHTSYRCAIVSFPRTSSLAQDVYCLCVTLLHHYTKHTADKLSKSAHSERAYRGLTCDSLVCNLIRQLAILAPFCFCSRYFHRLPFLQFTSHRALLPAGKIMSRKCAVT